MQGRLPFYQFELEVVHRAGIKLQAADALSPLSTDGKDKTYSIDTLLVLTIEPANHAKQAEEIDENTTE